MDPAYAPALMSAAVIALIGVLVLGATDPRLLRQTSEGIATIFLWPVIFGVRTIRRSRQDEADRQHSERLGHNTVAQAVRAAVEHLPEHGLLLTPARDRIRDFVEAADALPWPARARREYSAAFGTAADKVDALLARAEDMEEEGEMAFVPLVSDLLREVPIRQVAP